jgi:hypothetical protein
VKFLKQLKTGKNVLCFSTPVKKNHRICQNYYFWEWDWTGSVLKRESAALRFSFMSTTRLLTIEPSIWFWLISLRRVWCCTEWTSQQKMFLCMRVCFVCGASCSPVFCIHRRIWSQFHYYYFPPPFSWKWMCHISKWTEEKGGKKKKKNGRVLDTRLDDGYVGPKW